MDIMGKQRVFIALILLSLFIPAQSFAFGLYVGVIINNSGENQDVVVDNLKADAGSAP